MGVLQDKKDEKKTTKANELAKATIGYAQPLFELEKGIYRDDRMMGGSKDKMLLQSHNKEKAMTIVGGIITDIFFRSEYLERENPPVIPDFAEPVSEAEQNKSLRNVKRKDILETRPKKKVSRRRNPSRPKRRRASRGRLTTGRMRMSK